MALSVTRLQQGKKSTAQAVVFAVFAGERAIRHPFAQQLSPANRRYLTKFITKGFSNTVGEVDFVVFPSGKPACAFLVGLGKRSEWSLRRQHLFFRRLVHLADQQKIVSLAVHIPSLVLRDEGESDAVRHAAENLVLARYQYSAYKKAPSTKRRLSRVELVTTTAAAASALRTGLVVGAVTNACRDLSNTPAGDMTPALLADQARRLAKEAGVRIRVLDEKEIAKEKMGAILGVARGSTEQPRFIIMEYFGGKKNAAPLVLVGKGVTFDSGGINLKPTQGLSDMHMDMSGGAAAIAAMTAIAKLKLPLNAVALVPAVENMPSGSGYRPGDVLRSRSGKTIEIGNTDAEGRVILADALDYAKQFKPSFVIDVATLTGAAEVALGHHRNALFCSDQVMSSVIADLAERAGDPVWPLPLGEEYVAEIKGGIGEWLNSATVRVGGATHGAVFLQQFAGSMPWAHLDIAPMMTSVDGQHLARGASGTGVRLLVALAEYFVRR